LKDPKYTKKSFLKMFAFTYFFCWLGAILNDVFLYGWEHLLNPIWRIFFPNYTPAVYAVLMIIYSLLKLPSMSDGVKSK
jgi:hypothetical protein